VSEQPSPDSTEGSEGFQGTGPSQDQHADLPADAASSGRQPAGGEPTPGSDNDGAEAGYTPPSGTDGA
jgi:hypothetical protein